MAAGGIPAALQAPPAFHGPSFLRTFGLVLRRKPSRALGVVILIFFTLLGIFGPMMYPSPLPINASLIYAGPSWAHPLGTDFAGTDVLAEVITGGRYVLFAAALSALFAIAIGTGVGLITGYFRGFADSALMRVTEFFLTIPQFPLLVVLSTVIHFGSPITLGLVLGLTGWGSMARAVRSQTLSLRERGFVDSVQGLGLSPLHIIVREILPNVAPYVAMNLLVSITGSIYNEVGLFFLGLLPYSQNNWGVMLYDAFYQAGVMYTRQAVFYLLAPLIAILLITLGVVLVLDAVDELLNPRLREV